MSRLPSNKRPNFLGPSNISRYEQEFVQLEEVGSGEFGTVFKCQNRLDGVTYAIKRSKNAIMGFGDEQKLLREVYAHAILQVQPHIVRYYSAWEEDNRMLIQSEFCDGGSLEDVISANQKSGRSFTESELKTILRHVTLGVKCLHKQNLAHLDIKPGNIFIKTEVSMESESESVSDRSTMSPTTTEAPDTEVFEEVFGESVERRNTPPPSAVRQKTKVYKLGDLGMVTRIDEPSVEEGDCRYLSREIMNEDYTHLAKADIFSLGCSLYEAASGHELPKNGPEWHQLRDGSPQPLPRYSVQLNQMLQLMLHPNPDIRPSADAILKHPLFVSSSTPVFNKSRSQLYRELKAEKLKTYQLNQALEDAKKQGHGQSQPGEGTAELKKATRPGKPLGRSEKSRLLARSSSVSW